MDDISDIRTYPPELIDFSLFNKATALHDQQRFEEAADIWATMSREIPGHVESLINYSFCMLHLGKQANSLPAIKQALTLEPDNATALSHLKSMLSKLHIKGDDSTSSIYNKVYNRRGNDMSSSLFRLKDIGFAPQYILDIGAHKATWSTAVNGIFHNTQILMLEAQKELEPHLKQFCEKHNGRHDYIIALLGDEDKENVIFHQTEGAGTGSSVFEEQSNISSSEVGLTMHRLDTLISQNPKLDKPYELAKLDVQGAEIIILEGAKNTIKNVEFIYLEVSLFEYNKGGPQLTDIIDYMDSIDFICLDVADIQRFISRFPMQIDLLFIKKDSPRRQEILDDKAV